MIEINEEYGFESDKDKNIILMRKAYKREKVNGKIIQLDEFEFTPCGYYPNVKTMLRDLTRKEIKGTGMKTLADIDAKIDKIYEYIDKVVNDLK